MKPDKPDSIFEQSKQHLADLRKKTRNHNKSTLTPTSWSNPEDRSTQILKTRFTERLRIITRLLPSLICPECGILTTLPRSWVLLNSIQHTTESTKRRFYRFRSKELKEQFKKLPESVKKKIKHGHNKEQNQELFEKYFTLSRIGRKLIKAEELDLSKVSAMCRSCWFTLNTKRKRTKVQSRRFEEYRLEVHVKKVLKNPFRVEPRFILDANALWTVRDILELSQKEVAVACGWSQVYQHKLESGDINSVSEATFKQLEQVFTAAATSRGWSLSHCEGISGLLRYAQENNNAASIPQPDSEGGRGEDHSETPAQEAERSDQAESDAGGTGTA